MYVNRKDARPPKLCLSAGLGGESKVLNRFSSVVSLFGYSKWENFEKTLPLCDLLSMLRPRSKNENTSDQCSRKKILICRPFPDNADQSMNLLNRYILCQILTILTKMRVICYFKYQQQLISRKSYWS